MDSAGDTVAWPEWLVADPHQALCEQVGPPPSDCGASTHR